MARVILRALLLLAAACLGLVASPAGAEPMGNTHHLAIRLVPDTLAPRAGGTVTVALATTPEGGWHGYWQNPGDAGFPTSLAWTLPAGVTAGPMRYPVPTTLLVAGLMNYVYERPYAPLVDLRIPAGLATGTKLPIRLHANYLVCSATICVPETADLSVDLAVGDGAPANGAAFAGWRRALPQPLGAVAHWAVANGRWRLAIPYPAAAPLADAYFFPLAAGALDAAAPQTVTRDGDRLLIETAAAKPAGAIDGVLRIADGRGLSVHAVPGPVAVAQGGGGAASAGVAATALLAFAGAVLGGLILNVMPCVFPILSLKALGLARSGAGAGEARAEALAYTAGVVLVCLALGGVILGLRAGGHEVGWAFQLQNPRVTALLLLLALGIALNLAGLFELPTPPVAAGTGGAFATGALAAFVATPCSGPFMGAALGAALVLPWPAALAVFAGLGVGLALPFLLIGFVPALRTRLPRPGAWMATLRRVLSVPMFLTAIALGWVLGRQAGVDGLTIALVAALAVGLVLWTGGRRQLAGRGFGWGAAGALVVVAALGSGLAANGHAPAAAASTAGGDEAFTEPALARHLAAHQPVFAYFTADWCLTCKVNEHAAIDTRAARDHFAATHTAVMVGDWTNGDPALGRFIEAHNRAGVPLYLYWSPGAAEPRVLPQVLTPGLLAGL